MQPPLGHHITLDLYDCECDIEILEKLERGLPLIASCKEILTPLGQVQHQFSPSGWTAVVALAESHFTIHTWPQRKFVACDFYTCSGKFPEEPAELAIALFQPTWISRENLTRGGYVHARQNVRHS